MYTPCHPFACHRLVPSVGCAPSLSSMVAGGQWLGVREASTSAGATVVLSRFFRRNSEMFHQASVVSSGDSFKTGANPDLLSLVHSCNDLILICRGGAVCPTPGCSPCLHPDL